MFSQDIPRQSYDGSFKLLIFLQILSNTEKSINHDIFSAPEFKQCPAKLTIEVNSYDKLVDLKKAVLPKLSAVDGNGHPLDISLNHWQLEHCVCPQSQRNIHNIVATTKPDKYGRTAACVMAIRVKGKILC